MEMKVIALVITLVFIQVKPAASQRVLSPATVGKLDSIATQDVPLNAPGIATAVIEDGRVIYQKYAGLADLKDGTPIGSSTRFNIASNGKQFTALAILALVSEGKLRLTDDIRKWFPNLYPNVRQEITVQALLNHTSGIRDCYDLWSLEGQTWWKNSFDNNDVLTLIGRQREMNFPAGSRYLYSNTNYILLALLIEKVTGETFVDHTNDMFRRLHMPGTSFESDHGSIRGPIARAYFNFGSWTTYDWIWNVCGDGNLFSTLEDQIQWERLVQGRGSSGLGRKIIRLSQQAIEGSGFENYGYGLEFGSYRGLDYRFHEGATGAWKATVLRFPRENLSLVTLTNTGKSIPSTQTRQMADILLGLEPDGGH